MVDRQDSLINTRPEDDKRGWLTKFRHWLIAKLAMSDAIVLSCKLRGDIELFHRTQQGYFKNVDIVALPTIIIGGKDDDDDDKTIERHDWQQGRYRMH